MNVGVMKDYKLRDLRASHTLGWQLGCVDVILLWKVCYKSKELRWWESRKLT
jgi:hypothetical protein